MVGCDLETTALLASWH